MMSSLQASASSLIFCYADRIDSAGRPMLFHPSMFAMSFQVSLEGCTLDHLPAYRTQ
jgi:hypothetical protein